MSASSTSQGNLSALTSSVRCAHRAARGTSATCLCRGTRAAPFSPPPLLWSAPAGGFFPGRRAASASSSSVSSQPDMFEEDKLYSTPVTSALYSTYISFFFPLSDNTLCLSFVCNLFKCIIMSLLYFLRSCLYSVACEIH